MITFITDQRSGEPDILAGNESKTLVVQDGNGNELLRMGPVRPWSHEALCELSGQIGGLVPTIVCPVDAFLGDQWVGSSEV